MSKSKKYKGRGFVGIPRETSRAWHSPGEPFVNTGPCAGLCEKNAGFAGVLGWEAGPGHTSRENHVSANKKRVPARKLAEGAVGVEPSPSPMCFRTGIRQWVL